MRDLKIDHLDPLDATTIQVLRKFELFPSPLERLALQEDPAEDFLGYEQRYFFARLGRLGLRDFYAEIKVYLVCVCDQPIPSAMNKADREELLRFLARDTPFRKAFEDYVASRQDLILEAPVPELLIAMEAP